MSFPNLFQAERVYGNLNLGPGHFMISPGGFIGLNNRKGTVRFVDPLFGNNAWDGSLPKRNGLTTQGPKLTIAAALAIAADYDVIICSWGDINEDNLIVSQKALKLIGLSNSGLTRGSPLFIGSAAKILAIEADDVEIAGFGFYQTFADTCISIAENPSFYWRTYIHDCGFSGDNTGLWGIKAGAVAAEGPYTIVERCRFYNLAAGGVRLNSSAMVIKDSIFSVMAGALGIEDVPNSSSRPDRYILNNKFITLDNVNALGVKVTNTPDPGQLMIDGNHFVNFADAAHAISASGVKPGLIGLNYLGVTAIPI
jgi:hypothetical protein